MLCLGLANLLAASALAPVAAPLVEGIASPPAPLLEGIASPYRTCPVAVALVVVAVAPVVVGQSLH